MKNDDDVSLRDSIASAMDAAEKPAEPAPTEPAPEAAPPTGASSSPDNAASETPAAGPGETAKPAAPEENAKPSEPAADAPKPPPGFPGGDQAWAGLPPDTRTWVKAREAQFARHFQQNAEAAKFGASMWGAIRPYEASLRAAGVHPAQVVQEAMNLNFVLSQGTQAEKAAAIQRMAHHAGVDLSAVAGQPETAQASPEVDELRNTVRALVNHLRGQEQQQVRQQVQQATSTVEEFSRDTSRKYINDPKVRETMANMLDIGMARDLDHAYKLAIRTQDHLHAEIAAEDAARRAAEARKAAAEATPRGGAPVAAVMSPNDDSLRGTIERAFEAHSRRAA